MKRPKPHRRLAKARRDPQHGHATSPTRLAQCIDSQHGGQSPPDAPPSQHFEEALQLPDPLADQLFGLGSMLRRGIELPAAHRRTVCRLTPMVRASSLCHSGPQTSRPKRSNLAASRQFTLSLLTAGRD